MFRKFKDRQEQDPVKPKDEALIESDAHEAITESRTQIDRARTILEREVRRLDSILEGK